jgi:hypothetical protein
MCLYRKTKKNLAIPLFFTMFFSVISYAFAGDANECAPYWLATEKNGNNTRDYQRNFHDALPNHKILDLKNFKPIQAAVEINRGEGESVKQTYQDDKGSIWMVDFAKPKVEQYIIGGLYKLILGEHAPNEQLIKKEKEVYQGSEFIKIFIRYIDFISANKEEADKMKKWDDGEECGYREYRKKCLADNFCHHTVIKNVNMVIAAMILLQENDAHGRNVGMVCDDTKKSCELAKIDHERSSLPAAFLLQNEQYVNLRGRANNLLATTNVRDWFDDVFNNNYDLASAMEEIAAIPDKHWENVVKERIATYQQEVGQVASAEELLARSMLIKKLARHFAQSLYIEGAILKGSIEDITKIVNSGLDLNKEYSTLQIGGHQTPLEMAIVAKKQNAVEYLFDHSNDEVRILGWFAAKRSKNDLASAYFLKKQFNVDAFNLNDYPMVFQRILEMSPYDDYKEYEQLIKIKCTTYDDYLSQINILMYSFETSFDRKRCFGFIKEMLRNFHGAGAEKTKKAVETVAKHSFILAGTVFDKEVFNILAKEVNDESFFIKIAVKAGLYLFSDEEFWNRMTILGYSMRIPQPVNLVDLLYTKDGYIQVAHLLSNEWLLVNSYGNLAREAWAKILVDIINHPYIDKVNGTKIYLNLIKQGNRDVADLVRKAGKVDYSKLPIEGNSLFEKCIECFEFRA